jgi:preprotein translocase subunit SecG
VSTLILIIHVIVCFILIFAVLLQSGKSADLAGAFGGAGSSTAFGPRGSATLMSKITTASAILFMFTSMGLWILSTKGAKSVVRGEAAPKAAQTAPAAAPVPKQEEPKAPPAETPAQTQEKAPATDPEKK